MDDATQYWIFLIVVGDRVISRQEATAQRHFRALLQSVLPDLTSDATFPHRDIQRSLVRQIQSQSNQSQHSQFQPPQARQAQWHQAPVPTVMPERVPVSTAAPAMTTTETVQAKTSVGVLSRQPSQNQSFNAFSPSQSLPISADEMVAESAAAELCLRCAISHQIDYACQQLADQFGPSHGFTRMLLVAAVLNDEYLLAQQRSPRSRRQVTSVYRSLATEIFETFNPERSSLRVWTVRRVRHDNTINQLLLEHGVYFVSDWAILNDTNEAQVERILGGFYSLGQVDIRVDGLLLESYHTVYRGDRLQQQQKGRCLAPTPNQLSRISQHLQTLQQEEGLTQLPVPSPAETLQRLQTLAHYLRDYRIHNRGGRQVVESIDDPAFNPSGAMLSVPAADLEEDQDNDVMALYGQVFEQSLDHSIQTVVERRVAQLRKRKGNRDQLFLKGLELFHSQGLTMTEIAPHLGYERQDKVSFLLKLKDLRADVRHELLQQLRQEVVAIAQKFASADQLASLDQQIDAVLEEQIGSVMTEAERETSGARNGPLHSRFARRLCHYLNYRSN